VVKTSSFADVDRALDAVRADIPKAALLDGHQLDNIVLSTTEFGVAHKLGRTPRGYLVVKRNASATVYGVTAANATYLYLKASGAVTVSLWVY
jgi:hypothetical protein